LKNKAVDSKQRKDYYRNDGRFSHDMKRQQFLESSGLTELRFNGSDVKSDMDNMLMAIQGWLKTGGTDTRKSAIRKQIPVIPPLEKGDRGGCVLSPAPCCLLLTHEK
jgi:hypothetical protein